jgi:hypothetical protein
LFIVQNFRIKKSLTVGTARASQIVMTTVTNLNEIAAQIFLVALIMTITAADCNAQTTWEWGWQNRSEQKDAFQIVIETDAGQKPLYSKLIWFYKREVAPRQQRRCPFYPTCSTYTLYSMRKYGFFWGFLMGIERLYFRENPTVYRRTHYHSCWHNGDEHAYDPPEANFIFGEKDWRTIDPDFYPLFYRRQNTRPGLNAAN